MSIEFKICWLLIYLEKSKFNCSRSEHWCGIDYRVQYYLHNPSAEWLSILAAFNYRKSGVYLEIAFKNAMPQFPPLSSMHKVDDTLLHFLRLRVMGLSRLRYQKGYAASELSEVEVLKLVFKLYAGH